MGLLRVLLALAVVLEHTGGLRGYVMIGGPLAVQAFFIISGFYMGLVLNEKYDRPALNRAFYANRAIRIYALYFVFLAVYLTVFVAAQAGSGASPLWPYLEDTVGAGEKLLLGALNLTVIGQDVPLFLSIREGHLAPGLMHDGFGRLEPFRFMLIPVAWSMSLELCFYALAPFIVRRPAGQIAALLGLSLAARIVAAGLGLVQDPFSYRFFPFELALFLAGVLAYKAFAACPARWESPPAKALALMVPLAIAAYPWLLGSWPYDSFFTPARMGLLALVAAALPAIHGWSRFSRRDRAIGELSYPLYLGHLLVYGLIGGLPALRGDSALRTLAVAAASLLLAWAVTQVVDSRIETFRRRLAEKAGAVAKIGA